jgi:hypothetical protein
MPKVSLSDLIAKRVGPSVPKATRLTYEEIAERSGGLISATHINDLKVGRRDPKRLTVEKILALAKGLHESPVVVFEACTGELYPGLNDATVAQLLSDYSELRSKGRANTDLEFAMRLLREKVEQALQAKSHRNT